MDKVFKKIIEGLEIFDTLYERHENVTSSSQKEKLESDLKKEIKKLQRFREQVKNWQAGNEIKDKNSLLEHRRLVEVAMEKYKVVEKGSKTKAYSDQSLAAVDEPKVDNEACEFVRQALETLGQQTESIEAEIERLQPSKKGKRNVQNEEMKKELEELLASHQWHTEKLEIILRLLQNEVLNVDEVMNISEDITYYLDENRAPDFMFDDTIYDDLDLEADQALINDIHLLHEEPSVQPPSSSNSRNDSIPEQGPKSRSSTSNHSGSNSRSNSVQASKPPLVKQSSTSSVGILSSKITNVNNNHDSHENPPVIQSIGTSSNNQATVTTLKPAPVPVTGEIKWSSVVNAVKKKDTSVTPPASKPASMAVPLPTPVNEHMSTMSGSNSVSSPAQTAEAVSIPNSTINSNALNAASVLEALKKQKPKEEVTTNSSTSTTTITSGANSKNNYTSVSSSAIEKATESLNGNAVTSLSAVHASSSSPTTESVSFGFTKSQKLAAATDGFRFLPPGIQSFILSISKSKDVMTSNYNPFQTINHTPNGTFPSGLKGNSLAEIWNKSKTSSELSSLVSTLNFETLFFGYYYGKSNEERDFTLSALKDKGWKKHKSEVNWYLVESVISQGEGWCIGDCLVFNVDSWSTTERKNTKIEMIDFI